jgi:nucleolar protein 56
LKKFPISTVITGGNDDEGFKMITHILFESASGYAIFEAKLIEDIGSKSGAVQESIKDLAKFGKMVSLLSFSPFKNAAQALENANDVSEGKFLNPQLQGYVTLT